MADDDITLFYQEMGDVVPLKREHRVALGGGAQDDRDSSLAERRQAAVAAPEADRNILNDREVEPLDPWYVLDFKRPGVQNGVYRKLRQGRYEQEARLDLHRMSVRVARKELFEFIEQCFELGLRSVMLIHGKGERGADRERSAVLKGHVNVWLREMPVVQAFHSAQARHGGTGAAYVLLRKSEEQKRINRERFMKGRVPIDK